MPLKNFISDYWQTHFDNFDNFLKGLAFTYRPPFHYSDLPSNIKKLDKSEIFNFSLQFCPPTPISIFCASARVIFFNTLKHYWTANVSPLTHCIKHRDSKGFSSFCIGLYNFFHRSSTGTLEYWPGSPVCYLTFEGWSKTDAIFLQLDLIVARHWAVLATAAADMACSLQIPSQYKSLSAKLCNRQDAEHQGQSSSVKVSSLSSLYDSPHILHGDWKASFSDWIVLR